MREARKALRGHRSGEGNAGEDGDEDIETFDGSTSKLERDSRSVSTGKF